MANWLVAGVIITALMCRPFAANWDPTSPIPGAECMDKIEMWRYANIPNILTDLAILFLPVSTLYGLQTTRMRKVGLFITFLTGAM